MDWLALIAGLPTPGSIAAGARAYLRGQIITQAVRAGASANSIISALVGSGYGLRRSTMLQTIAAERSRQAASATSNEIDYTQSTAELLATPPPAGWTGRYVHQVTATYRERDEEGNYTLHTRTLGVVSGEPLSPEDAVAAALDIMSQSAPLEEGGSDIDVSSLLALDLTGMWWQVRTPRVGSAVA